MRRRLFAMMRKECIHIVRDRRSLLIVLLMPILMIVLYGYAITLDMRGICFAVIDDANTPESRALLRTFADNAFFTRSHASPDRAGIEELFRRREAHMVLRIPRDFSLHLLRDGRATVQVLVDASDSNVGAYVNNYTNHIVRMYNRGSDAGRRVAYSFEPRILYNPEMKSSMFFVPGLVALILMLINALLTSIAITREKETGTMEQILVSPVHPFEIVVGKVTPYVAIGFVNAVMILVWARILFDLPIRGDLFFLAGQTLVYIFTALSFGLMISSVARTQQIAMLATLMATILPTIMLSGFIFPVASMPVPLQYVSKALPATYFLVIIRGVLLKGAGFGELAGPSLMLAGIGLFILAVATTRFRTTLD